MSGSAAPAAVSGIPTFGLGTYGRTGPDGLASLREALSLGYRHLDTAQSYNTEANVGRAVRESGLAREEVFITTKIADSNLGRGRLTASLRESLSALGVERADLTLIHWPSQHDKIPMQDFLQELLRAKRDGLTRLIGVSNFTIALLARAAEIVGAEEIATNQVEVHPYLQNRKLRAFSDSLGVATTAYMPLARGRVSTDPVMMEIGARRGCTGAQASLAWLVANGMIVIPSARGRAHMASNLGAADVALTPADIAAIDALDCGARIIDPPMAPDWDA